MFKDSLVVAHHLLLFLSMSTQPFLKHSMIKYRNSETLTWAREGSLLGAAIGVAMGLTLYLMLSDDLIDLPGVEKINIQGPFTFLFLTLVASAIYGAIAGALIGIGTPKFNPHPQQGLPERSKRSLLNRRRS